MSAPATYVRMQGGLGNQLFQYAFGLAKSIECDTELRLDTRAFDVRNASIVPRTYGLTAFGIDAPVATRDELRAFDALRRWWQWGHSWRSSQSKVANVVASRWLDATYVREGGFAYQPVAAAADGRRVYFEGYWQSPKYFGRAEEQIREHLDVSTTFDERAHELLRQITDGSSLCVNVRRGDFVTHARSSSFHGAMGTAYYVAAAEKLMERFPIDQVFVFSDEPEWCDQNLMLHRDQVVVDHRYAGPEFSWYLNLMAACSYFVIPNSSFGWWAAWIADAEPSRVVAPMNWFQDPTIDVTDLLNPEWVRL